LTHEEVIEASGLIGDTIFANAEENLFAVIIGMTVDFPTKRRGREKVDMIVADASSAMF
jgi:hypothetical protein